jgi:hypothetical protein
VFSRSYIPRVGDNIQSLSSVYESVDRFEVDLFDQPGRSPMRR